MAVIKKTTNNKCWRGYREKGIFLHSWLECKQVQSLWTTVWRFILKTRNNTTIGPSKPTAGHILRVNHNSKRKWEFSYRFLDYHKMATVSFAQASHCGGFSCCGSVVVAPQLWSTDSTVVARGLSCCRACGSFPDQGWNSVSCIGRQILYHWATRAALLFL